jgi:transcriptional regulator with XRE-family HTH domain
MDIKARIGKRIYELRLEKNLTQEAVAYKAEIDRTFMNHAEKGRRNISVETLEKILKGLDVSFNSFFNCEIFNHSIKKNKK